MDTQETGDDMPDYGLGFDTGGTYTDAVIMDMNAGEIVCSSKSLTTRNDYSLGIAGSISNFDKKLFKDIRVVSLSSTLATNSIVEGKGCRVALIAIGREFDMSIPVDEYICIGGGHDLSGKEKESLDEKTAENFLRHIEDKVDGIAITSYLSVRNPSHEIRLKELTKKILNVPVVCGHELSSSLGFNERTVTSVMNARLIPIIKDLIISVKKVMAENGIGAPLMIVKGDGSIMSENVALQRPVETILSGPAASLIGAKTLTGIRDAIVMDMGGTTTDIGILRDGSPRLEKEGAIIGGKRTRVMAAEISTSGIGGDSRIAVDGGVLKLMALRMMPLCTASDKYPSLKPKLKKVVNISPRFIPGCLDESKIIQETEFFIGLRDTDAKFLTKEDRNFLESIRTEPKSLTEVSEELGVHPYSFNITKMEGLGIVQRIGLTPTDILHAEGSYTEFDAEASALGVKHQSMKMNKTPEEFIALVKQKVIDKIARELLLKLFYEDTGASDMNDISEDLMTKAISGTAGQNYGCAINITKPIIGIGAPVKAYFPQVAKKFGTEAIFSEYSHVGNAVGAITGNVVESVEILIRPLKGEGAADDPGCKLFASFGTVDFQKYTEALEFAKEKGSAIATQRAVDAGADKVEIKIDQEDKRFGFGDSSGESVLIETHLTVTAVGKPKEFCFVERSINHTDSDE